MNTLNVEELTQEELKMLVPGWGLQRVQLFSTSLVQLELIPAFKCYRICWSQHWGWHLFLSLSWFLSRLRLQLLTFAVQFQISWSQDWLTFFPWASPVSSFLESTLLCLPHCVPPPHTQITNIRADFGFLLRLRVFNLLNLVDLPFT